MTEIERIRRKFGATRKQFGRIFIGKSETMVKYYEKELSKTPDCVLKLARMWEQFLDRMNGNDKEAGQEKR